MARDLEAVLLDIDDFTLADLGSIEHGVLAAALSRVIAEASGDDDPLARFQAVA